MTSTPPDSNFDSEFDPTDSYAVIGHPVEHSQSPGIHAAFAASVGHTIRYDRLLSPLDAFESTVRDFAGLGARGCNVTVPFKLQAFHLAARRTERAALAEAANTLRFDADGWLADNTDGAGLIRDIEHNSGLPIVGLRVLLIGAGGAAAGALGPLLLAGAAQVVVANRTLPTAAALVGRHRHLADAIGATLLAAPLGDPGRDFDVVINASASSLSGSAVPVPDHVMKPGGLALDMMYGAPARPFLGWAERRGAMGRDGLGMLVEQAAEAFLLWRGVRPETASVLAGMRARMQARIEGEAP